IHDSIHKPKTLGSDQPNPNKETPQERIVRKAESKAFLGEKKLSFAEKVAGKQLERQQLLVQSILSETECAISEEIKTGRQVPGTDQCNVVFWDLRTFKGELAEIRQAAEDSGAIGWTHRKQTEWLELAYATKGKRDTALATPIIMPRDQKIIPLPARKYSPQQVYIKLANVPIYPEQDVRDLIEEYFSTFGSVGAIEPHYIKGTKMLTRRWDLILTIPGGKVLKAPTIFDAYSCRICCYWKGSAPTCTTCKTVGHWMAQCNPRYRLAAEKRDAPQPANPIPKKAAEKVAEKRPTNEAQETMRPASEVISQESLNRFTMTEEELAQQKQKAMEETEVEVEAVEIPVPTETMPVFETPELPPAKR